MLKGGGPFRSRLYRRPLSRPELDCCAWMAASKSGLHDRGEDRARDSGEDRRIGGAERPVGPSWNINERGHLIDRGTQTWVRTTGKVVAFEDEPWLLGPTGGVRVVGDEWVACEADRLGAQVVDGGGLLDDFGRLAGDGFDPAYLQRPIADFYEHTSAWRLEVWSQWCPVVWPFGWLLSAVFAQRLQQLSLPLRPLDVAQGLDSQVLTVKDADGSQLGAAWLRKLRSTGQNVYSGFYGVTQLPKRDRPSVRVAFPLPNGSVTVFLRPDVGHDGALKLTSPLGAFGDDGAYLIVRRDDRSACVRRVPLAEQFVVWVDDEGTLRTDHALSLWQVPVLRFHYRLERRQPAT